LPETIFDNIPRSDPSPATPYEASFDFLNRVDSPYWQRVRDFVEDAFTRYPAEHAADLRARFRDDQWSAHIGAWWELYLYSLFRALGSTVEIHPEMPGTTTRPDFLIDSDFVVEARHVATGLVAAQPGPGRESWITGPLEELWHPNFRVSIRILNRDDAQPRRAAVTAGVLEWLDGLDADALLDAGPQHAPTFTQQAGGWCFRLSPMPVGPARRGDRNRRLIGIFPGYSGWGDNTVGTLRAALKEKARKYGKFGLPYAIAPLLSSGFTKPADIIDTLYGSDGFWATRNTRVSGVLVGTTVYPWSAGGPIPRLWLNLKAAHPLPTGLTVPTAFASDSRQIMQWDDDRAGFEIFGLPEDWPGPEPAFP
jgi:hypothetical protein